LAKFLKKGQNISYHIMDELSDDVSKNGLTIERLGRLME
jgi:hypothetical protein